jgi:hypothetical protein
VLFRELIRDGKPYPQRLAWSLQVEVNMEMDGDLTCLSRGYLMLRANATVIEHSVANVANAFRKVFAEAASKLIRQQRQ